MPLHPQVKQFLDAAAEQETPGWSEFTPSDARTEFASWTDMFGEGPRISRVEDRTIGSNIPIRIYQPQDSHNTGTVMYFHGGGWVLGNLDTHDSLCRRLAQESTSTVISVDYRCAPENPYPAALDDCYAATQFISENASQLDIDASSIVVAGDSAGGNLAATVCLRAREESGPPISGQLLIYPITAMDFDSVSYQAYATGFGLTRDSMIWFWEQYLGDQTVDALAAPLLAESLAALPPAHVITAEYDVLRTECEQFARRLTEAGVPVTTQQYDGVLHGFVHFSGLFDVGRAATADAAEAIRKMTSA